MGLHRCAAVGILLVAGLGFACALPAFVPSARATDLNLTPHSTKGTGHVQGVPYDGGRLQGDTVEDPFIITGWFYSGTGNTCGFTNNYEETCPFDESFSPDVVYEYSPGAGLSLRVDLCPSDYDTKLYIYDFAAGHGIGSPLACNDDACGELGYRSSIDFTSQPGHTYDIVIDGYSNDCGDYTLDIYEIVPGNLECPDGALLEGEPDCYDDYDDHFNGGCNATPPVFTYLTGTPQGEPFTVCGTSGTFYFGGEGTRDTDWFQLDVSEENAITFQCVAEFPLGISILDGNAGCDGMQYLDFASADPFEPATLTRTLAPGTYWFWVGPLNFGGVPCGSAYVMTITGYTAVVTPAETTTWGAVKHRFQ
jgi:hypothetical protein